MLLVSLILMSLSAGLGFAQTSGTQTGSTQTFKLSDIFETIQGFDVFETYEKFPYLIDTLIYFFFFISLAQATLGKHFEGRGGQGVVIAMGLALAVGISYWSQKVGFRLGNLGTLAALIFAIVIGIWLYRIIKGDQEAGAGIWISVVVGFIAFQMYFPDIVNAMQENKWGRLGIGAFTLLFVLAIPLALSSFFKGKDDDKKSGSFGGIWPGGKGSTSEAQAEKEEAEAEEKKAFGASARERQIIKQIMDIDASDLDADEKIKRQLEQIKDFIHQYLISKLPGTGGSYSEYRRRKALIIPKLQEIVNIMDNNHARYAKVNAVLQKNAEVIDFIQYHVAGYASHNEAALTAFLATHTTPPGHMPVVNLVNPAAGPARAVAAGHALDYLNDHILVRYTRRSDVIVHIKQKLNEALDELNKTEPKFPDPKFISFTKKIYANVEKRIEETFNKFDYVIKVDKEILQIGSRMVRYDEFLIKMLNGPGAPGADATLYPDHAEGVPGTVGPPPY